VKKILFIKAIAICIFCLTFITPLTVAENIKTIAILPFEMISNKDISYLQEGILQMLHSRLNWEGHVSVIKKKNMDDLLKTIDKNSTHLVQDILDRTHTDYIITGSVTQFANAFSIDTKTFDVKNSQSLSFFDQSTNINEVIPKLNIIAAKINKKVLNRKTATYNKLENDQLKEVEKLKRQNPERMMPQVPQGERQEKTKWWKFWEFL
jgi:TolB-like protein